ncbi:MAG: glycosyltransferase [Phycisphaerae bacterium]
MTPVAPADIPLPAAAAEPVAPVKAPRIAVLVPCYNEAITVGAVVRDFRRALPEAAIYVFDNNSSDDTAALARQAGAVVIREKKQGKGHVVAAMLEKVEADCYVMVDGDDTYPAEAVRELLAPVLQERADMAVGRRMAVDQRRAYRRFHVFGNRLVVWLINTIFGAKLTDIMSGYRAFTRAVALHLPVLAYGFDIETEMTLQCLYRRWVIVEVPVAYRERPAGSASKLNTVSDGLRVLFRILNVFRSYKPLTFFGLIGLALLAAAGGFGLAALAGAGRSGAYRTSMIVLAAAAAAMSLVSAAIGVIVQHVNFRFLELDSLLRRRK